MPVCIFICIQMYTGTALQEIDGAISAPQKYTRMLNMRCIQQAQSHNCPLPVTIPTQNSNSICYHLCDLLIPCFCCNFCHAYFSPSCDCGLTLSRSVAALGDSQDSYQYLILLYIVFVFLSSPQHSLVLLSIPNIPQCPTMFCGTSLNILQYFLASLSTP